MKVSIKKTATGSLDQVYDKVSKALQSEGFGILTRIDFHQKIQEKLGKQIPQTIILGACHPGLAFEAVNLNPEVVNLMPCNVVLSENGTNKWNVEFALAKPILSILNDSKLDQFASGVDEKIAKLSDLIN